MSHTKHSVGGGAHTAVSSVSEGQAPHTHEGFSRPFPGAGNPSVSKADKPVPAGLTSLAREMGSKVITLPKESEV